MNLVLLLGRLIYGSYQSIISNEKRTVEGMSRPGLLEAAEVFAEVVAVFGVP